MSHRTTITYYAVIATVVIAQTVATVFSGGSVVLHSSAIAELKHEQQQLLEKKHQLSAELTRHSALSALPPTALDGYTAITQPLILASVDTLASTQR